MSEIIFMLDVPHKLDPIEIRVRNNLEHLDNLVAEISRLMEEVVQTREKLYPVSQEQ